MEAAGRLGAALVVAVAIFATPVEAGDADLPAFLLDLVGADASQDVRLPDGTVATLGEIVARRVAEATTTDPASVRGAGDVWVLERGHGVCERRELAEQPVRVPLHPRAAVHGGYVGELSTGHGHATSIYSWWTGSATTRFDTQGFTVAGNVDPWCLETAEGHFALPFVNGVAWFN